MSAETEKAMLEAITAHFADESPYNHGDDTKVTRLRALEVRVVTDYPDAATCGRAFYANAENYEARFILTAPWGNCRAGADAPEIRGYEENGWGC